jgi:exodeoxyribonuclease-3
MKITTWNVNSLRAALRKSFEQHLAGLAPDVLMLQEVRCLPEQLPWRDPPGFVARWHPAQTPGYSGVATWARWDGSRHEMELVGTGITGHPDPDGRVLRTRVMGVEIVDVYAPSGSAGPESQARKDRFMEAFLPFAQELARAAHPVVMGGDLNVCHTEDDIHDPRGNKKHSGFLPHERAWMSAVLDCGWTDLVRKAVGPRKGPYSWWSSRGRAKAEDRGWRIDYLLGNAAATERFAGAHILRAAALDTSDHAPVTIELSP